MIAAVTASIPSPSSNGVHLGPLFMHAYGLMYVLAVGAAILISRRRWTQSGGDGDLAYEVALWAFPAGLIGGRIYFDITTPGQVPDHWWGPFAIWQGGLGIWGGVAAGAAVGVWRAQRRLGWSELRRFADAVAPSLLVAQSFGRVGNYFNQELFGAPSRLPWALEISRAHRISALSPRYWQYSTFEPTFLYEIVWNLLLASFLVWLGHRRRVRAPGLFALYIAGYSGFRMFEETQRIDYSNYLLGMRLNFWIATILCIAGLAWFLRIQRDVNAPFTATPLGRAGALLSTVLAVALAGCGRGANLHDSARAGANPVPQVTPLFMGLQVKPAAKPPGQ